MEDKILGVNEIRQRLGLSEKSVMDLIHFEQLPAVKVNGQWQLSESDLITWQNNEPAETKKANAPLKSPKKASKKADSDGEKTGLKK